MPRPRGAGRRTEHRMNLRQLEVFKAIMETGSTIAAATTLGLSQSAISRQLSALESEIGMELFVRDKGRLIARPEAQALVWEVEELAESFHRVRRRVSDVKAGAFGETLVKIAFPHSLTTTMVPPMVGAFLSSHPEVTVELLSGPYDAIERMVRARIADFGFVRLPPEDRTLAARPMVTSSTSCVMSKDHPLAEKSVIRHEDLARRDLILLGRQRSNRNELEYELRRAVPAYRCRLEVHSVETACACAAEGLGVAIVPTLIAGFFASDRLAMRPFRPQREYQYGIVSLPGAPLSRSAEALVGTIGEGLDRLARTCD